VRKGSANQPTTTISKTINVTITNEKVQESPNNNGWDLTKAFVEAKSNVYHIEMYSFYKYEDIGIKKDKNGKIKCYCTDIIKTKEIFDSETKIESWNTGSAKVI